MVLLDKGTLLRDKIRCSHASALCVTIGTRNNWIDHSDYERWWHQPQDRRET